MTKNLEETCRIEHADYFSSGTTRTIYTHPRDKKFLVKIPRNERDTQNLAEFDSYRFVKTRKLRFIKYLPEILGFQKTNLGTGLVIEKIGEATNNLQLLLRSNQISRADATKFVDEVFACAIQDGVCIWDSNPENFVVEQGRVYIVDGLIHKHMNAKYYARKYIKAYANRRTKIIHKQTLRKIANVEIN